MARCKSWSWGLSPPGFSIPYPEIDDDKVLRSEVRMLAAWIVLAALLGGSVSALAAPKGVDAPGDPKLLSIHPFTSQRGAQLVVTARGNGLRDATAVVLENAPFTAVIDGTEPEAADKNSKAPVDAIRIRIQVDEKAKPGRYSVRLVTPRGISNARRCAVLLSGFGAKRRTTG